MHLCLSFWQKGISWRGRSVQVQAGECGAFHWRPEDETLIHLLLCKTYESNVDSSNGRPNRREHSSILNYGDDLGSIGFELLTETTTHRSAVDNSR